MKNLVTHPTFKDGVLEPENVAEEVVKRVMNSGSGEMFLPAYGGVLSGIRGFPTWLQELVRDSKANVLREASF